MPLGAISWGALSSQSRAENEGGRGIGSVEGDSERGIRMKGGEFRKRKGGRRSGWPSILQQVKLFLDAGTDRQFLLGIIINNTNQTYIRMFRNAIVFTSGKARAHGYLI